MRRDGRYIAGALNFIGADTLFGRYWGCLEHHSCLHFEVCYYRAIEFAIENRLRSVEAEPRTTQAGTGLHAVKVHSLHWIAHPGFRRAVLEYLQVENQEIDHVLEALSSRGPYRKGIDNADA